MIKRGLTVREAAGRLEIGKTIFYDALQASGTSSEFDRQLSSL
jgi:hypothetical protein